jgi:hypothetical protein
MSQLGRAPYPQAGIAGAKPVGTRSTASPFFCQRIRGTSGTCPCHVFSRTMTIFTDTEPPRRVALLHDHDGPGRSARPLGRFPSAIRRLHPKLRRLHPFTLCSGHWRRSKRPTRGHGCQECSRIQPGSCELVKFVSDPHAEKSKLKSQKTKRTGAPDRIRCLQSLCLQPAIRQPTAMQ